MLRAQSRIGRFPFIYSYPLITSHILVISSKAERLRSRDRGPISISLLIISSISNHKREKETERERGQSSRFRGKITFGDGAACNERTKASAASNVRNYSILAIKSGAGSALASSTPLFVGGSFIVTNVGTMFCHYIRSYLGGTSDIPIIFPIANRTIVSSDIIIKYWYKASLA